MKTVYLDFAAATPMDETVLEAMRPYFSDNFYNPAAGYLAAKAVKDDIAEAKKSIAGVLGAKQTEIIATSGGTESNNLAIRGVLEKFPGKKVLVSAVEHESVLEPAGRYDCSQIPVDGRGVVQLEALRKLITDEVVLVSVMLVGNETGTIQPARKIAELVKEVTFERRKKGFELPLYLHTDAAQAPCYVDISANRLGADLITLNGGKIYGVKGTGILFVKTGVELQPQVLGGGQQRGRRSGTENPAGLIGFAKALEIAARNRRDETARLEKLRAEFISGLLKIDPKIAVNGHPKNRSPHILSVTFPGADNERLLYLLEEKGILAAAGSACSAGSDKPSHVLGAMGLSDNDIRSSLRFSFGRQTTDNSIKSTIRALAEIL